MNLSRSEVAQLRKLVAACGAILSKIDAAPPKVAIAGKKAKPARTRRSGKELAAFRKLLKSERKRGVPVAELAEQHGVSTAYIYMIK